MTQDPTTVESPTSPVDGGGSSRALQPAQWMPLTASSPSPSPTPANGGGSSRAPQPGQWIPLAMDTPLRNPSAESLDLPPLLPNTTEVPSLSEPQALPAADEDLPAVLLRLPSVSEDAGEETRAPLVTANGHVDNDNHDTDDTAFVAKSALFEVDMPPVSGAATAPATQESAPAAAAAAAEDDDDGR